MVGLVDHHTLDFGIVADNGTDAGKLPRIDFLQVFHFLLGVVFGIGVEAAQHRLDTRAYHLLGIERVDVHQVEVLVDAVEYIELFLHLEVMVAVGLGHRHIGGKGGQQTQQDMSCFHEQCLIMTGQRYD